MSDQHFFHLTLGPVQGFVAQARRTRDFWAGSFLLSWLASVAMASVQQQGGQIRFPIPDERFLDALQGRLPPGEPLPEQGSVPNRFKALGAQVERSFDPHAVVAAIQEAWLHLCQYVWEGDLRPVLVTSPDNRQHALSRAIWERQLTGYWEINWCLTADEHISDVLDRRKNWRNHTLADEPGIKCMMMEGFQELSGQVQPGAKQRASFWQTLRERGGMRYGAQDLRPGECLSALGFVKRRFVRHFERLDVQLANGVRLKGWKLKPQVPSVLYMAAAPWYAQAMQRAAENFDVREALYRFTETAETLTGFPEAATPLRSVVHAVRGCGLDSEWAGLDGVVFHASQLELGAQRFDNPQAAAATLNALNGLRTAAKLPEPSRFYAVLIMDGDSLGRQMSDPGKQTRISQGLNHFTQSAPDIVRAHDGFLIYAGGDDVLALVTAEHAVELALALRQQYSHCFAEQNRDHANPVITSLSGAIQFCHIKIPLTFILNDAHRLLDEVAKDHTGRDALAVRVWKPGGLHLQWSQPWQHILNHRLEGSNLLSDVVRLFQHREAQSPFTHRFMFKVSEVLQRLPHALLQSMTPGQADASVHLLHTLLKAELLHSGLRLTHDAERHAEVERLLEPLVQLAMAHRREVDAQGQAVAIQSLGVFQSDALKLVRFLVKEAVLC